MTEPDLTGTWRGHYLQGAAEHGVTMRVVQKGSSLVGSMRDEETLWMSSDTLEREGDESTRQPVDMVTELPADSVIEGEIEGRRVAFEKRYCGPHTFTLWLHGTTASARIDDHRVLYRGELDSDGLVLRGEWTIPPQRSSVDEPGDEADGEGEGGAFVLRRDGSS